MKDPEKLRFARDYCTKHHLKCFISNRDKLACLVVDGICIAVDLHRLSINDIKMIIDIYRENKYIKS